MKTLELLNENVKESNKILLDLKILLKRLSRIISFVNIVNILTIIILILLVVLK